MAITRRIVRALALPLVLGGCAHPGPGFSSTASDEAPVLVAPFPARLQVLQSVVIRFHGHSFVALGWFRMDQPAGRFALTGMTPAGMTLFTLSDTGSLADASFTFPVSDQQGAWAAAMATDVRQIFLESAPRPGEHAERCWSTWTVTRRSGGPRTAELNFSGSDGHLVRAQWYENGERVGETRYDDFRLAGGHSMPFHVVHTQARFGYTLEIRIKEVQQAGGGGSP